MWSLTSSMGVPPMPVQCMAGTAMLLRRQIAIGDAHLFGDPRAGADGLCILVVSAGGDAAAGEQDSGGIADAAPAIQHEDLRSGDGRKRVDYPHRPRHRRDRLALPRGPLRP